LYSFQTISSQNLTSLVSETLFEKGRRIINNFNLFFFFLLLLLPPFFRFCLGFLAV